MSSESVLVWVLPLLGLLFILVSLALWLLWQLRTKAITGANTLTEQYQVSTEMRNALTKVILNTQRSNTLLESSAKDSTSHIEAIGLEVRQSLSFLTEALAEWQKSLPEELRNSLVQQLIEVLERQQHRTESVLKDNLSEELQIQLGTAFETQFQQSFDSLQVALPSLLREDFTNIFGTELDLIQKQIDSALDSMTSAFASGTSAESPQQYDDLKSILSAIQENIESLRQNQSDASNRQGEIQFVVRELASNFAAVETFMQEVTDIPRLTEQNLRKPIEKLQNLIKAQAGTIGATLETSLLPELISTETAKVTRKLAAHSTSGDIANLEGAFVSLLERRQKKEALLKTMSEIRSSMEGQEDKSTAPKQKLTTDSQPQEKMRLANDLQRLQNRLLAYEGSGGGTQHSVKAHQREVTALEAITSDEYNAVDEIQQTSKKPRLLIVDDSITNLSILKNILHHEIFDLTLVKDGNSALDSVADEPPDIVLLDIVLPDIDGYEVCKEIKSIPETRDIPVIFMSGMNDTQAIVKGFELGGADYVIKPFQQAEIIARLKFHYELYNIRRQQHKFIDQIQHEREKSDHLLKSILPEAIAERLKKGEGSIADGLPNVSVLFADIVGFTKLSSRVSPQELVEMLNVVFSAFDTLTQNYGLEKIKTIGDAYMVAGGLLNSRPDHLVAIAHLALDMAQEIKRCAEFLDADLNIRIGLNCGEATAGVIGQNKFAYDLWGDTVNTASRMESHGEPGRVHCSAAVYEALNDTFAFEERGEMEVKGKGMMKTYFLQPITKTLDL